MARVEIEESELLNNRKLQGLVSKMLGNKESRTLVLKAHKIVDPSVSIPEIDAKVPVENAVAAVDARLNAFRKEMSDKEAKEVQDRHMASLTTNWNTGRARLKAQRYTDEGIAAVEKLMEDKGIADHSDAQIIFEKLHPPSEVANPSPGSWGFFENTDKDSAEDMKRLLETHGEDEGVLRNMVSKTLADVRGR